LTRYPSRHFSVLEVINIWDGHESPIISTALPISIIDYMYAHFSSRFGFEIEDGRSNG